MTEDQVEREAERIVAENIDAWGWGPLDEVEGLSEHVLAVKAVAAGYRAAIAAVGDDPSNLRQGADNAAVLKDLPGARQLLARHYAARDGVDGADFRERLLNGDLDTSPEIRAVVAALGVGDEWRTEPTEVHRLMTPASDWTEKLEELMGWTGSAFLAGEKVEDEAQCKSDLYGFLCSLIGWLTTAEMAAEALAARPLPKAPDVTEKDETND
jgi:hypothetical protein